MNLQYATAEDDAAAEAGGLTALEPWRQPLRRSLRDAWESRHAVRPLMNSIIPDYRRAFLGRWWLFLRPALGVGGQALIFGGIFGARSPNGVPYLVFLLFGAQGWHLFQRTVVFETRSFRRFGRLTRNLKVPLLLLPVAAIGPALIQFFVYAGFATIGLVYYVVARGELYLEMGPQLLAGVAGWTLCVVFGWAVGMFLAVLNALYEDVRFTLGVVLQFWLYCTPVVYPLEKIPERFQPLAEVNPLTAVMELIKYGFLGSGEVHLPALAWSLVAIAGTSIAGLWFFNRYARVRTQLDDDEEDEDGVA